MKNKRVVLFMFGCLLVLFFLEYTLSLRQPIDWKPSYKKNDKIPYGMEAFYKTLPFLFPNQSIENTTLSIYNSLSNKTIVKTNYVIINAQFEPDKLDTRELLNFVKEGNTVFIASNYFGNEFKDSLKFETTVLFNAPEIKETDTFNIKKIFSWQESVNLNFYNPALKNEKGYTIVGFENSFFSSFDTLNTTALGNVDGKHVNFIKLHFGKGDFLILTSPETFTNYNFVNKENAEYVSKALSYLPQQKIIWDEYYKIGKVKEGDALTVILSKPALASAYYLLMSSIVIFVLIGIKRKQRIIPVIEPVKNTTLDFVTTIGTLYYQNGTHKEIAEKQINHFLSFIHSTFRVDIAQLDTQMISKISNRSGIELEKVSRLFDFIKSIREKDQLSERELLQLNAMIEDFYKQNKR